MSNILPTNALSSPASCKNYKDMCLLISTQVTLQKIKYVKLFNYKTIKSALKKHKPSFHFMRPSKDHCIE